MNIDQTYKYLGIYTGVGRRKAGSHVTNKLEEHLKQLSMAPLKPQQRLFILRVHVLPGLYHDLVLSKHSRALLVALDRKSRKAVRRWLHLPHDVPRALFHAQTVEGGLGLPELAVQIPLMRSARVEKLFDRAERGLGRDRSDLKGTPRRAPSLRRRCEVLRYDGQESKWKRAGYGLSSAY